MTTPQPPTVQHITEGVRPEVEVTRFKDGKRTRPARKQHTCDSCKGQIQPGQRYTRVFFLQDGKPTILKYHEARAEGDECYRNQGR